VRQRKSAEIRTPRKLAELTAAARKKLKTSQFALPSKRSKSKGSGGYPIEDAAHAQNALARVSQFGTPAEKAKVRVAVAKKYPNMAQKKMKGGK
jgi:hypothetical protein